MKQIWPIIGVACVMISSIGRMANSLTDVLIARVGMGFKDIETGAGCRHYHKIQLSQGCRLLPKGKTEDYTYKR